MRITLALALLILTPACTLRRAPENLLSAQWTFADASAEAGTTGPDPNLDVFGAQVTYELFPFEENGNIAIGYQYREHELVAVAGGPSVDTHALTVGPRWHFSIEDNFGWYVNPYFGLVILSDTNVAPGQDYSASPMIGGEAGWRWFLEQDWGLQGSVNWQVMWMRADNAGTPDLNIHGTTFQIGAFVDF